jgi:hypothetical protein
MNNAQNNESQDKQTERAADSPLKKPETETAHAKTSDVEKAAANQEAGAGGMSTGTRKEAVDQADLPSRANIASRAIDVLNDSTLDSTVDADGKNRDAAADESLLERNPDSFIGVNASLVNHVFEQGDGFGGFDSRLGRNGLLLQLEKGYHMVDRGMVSPSVDALEQQQLQEARDPHSKPTHGRRHFAINLVRPSRLIEIQTDEQ